VLKLKVELRQVIAPLVYEALEAPLRSYSEKHWREGDRNGLTSVTFRRKVAGLAAEHFAQRSGLVKWRGVIDQDTIARQLLVEITRLRSSHYRGQVKRTGIHTENITKLCRSKNDPRLA
jgi:hypothetical protein